MRFPATIVLVLAASVAGCAEPPEEEGEALFGLCPQWVQGPGEQRGTLDVAPTNATPVRLAPQGLQDDGTGDGAQFTNRSLDVVRVVFSNVTGRIEVRAYDTEGRQLGIRALAADGRQIEAVHAIDADDEGDEFDVHLTPITHDEAPRPGPVRLELRSDTAASAGFVATFHYKVCGAEP
jgi:hypothetical protein